MPCGTTRGATMDQTENSDLRCAHKEDKIDQSHIFMGWDSMVLADACDTMLMHDRDTVLLC